MDFAWPQIREIPSQVKECRQRIGTPLVIRSKDIDFAGGDSRLSTDEQHLRPRKPEAPKAAPKDKGKTQPSNGLDHRKALSGRTFPSLAYLFLAIS